MELLKEEENNRCNIKIERNKGIRAIKKQKQQEFIDMDMLRTELYNRNKIKNKQYRDFNVIKANKDMHLSTLEIREKDKYLMEDGEANYLFDWEDVIQENKGIVCMEREKLRRFRKGIKKWNLIKETTKHV